MMFQTLIYGSPWTWRRLDLLIGARLLWRTLEPHHPLGRSMIGRLPTRQYLLVEQTSLPRVFCLILTFARDYW
uniref:Uncharacterized protein n=1 Tax=Arundo donax TaxID=35708 RepID=A0A0A8YWM0_ARUDO